MNDLINEGFRMSVAGSANSGTDIVLLPVDNTRGLIVTGAYLSSDNATTQLVTLGFKTGVSATITFFEAYINSSTPASFAWPLGDFRYGDLNYGLVMTCGQSHVGYTVFCRSYNSPVPLGYIQQLGAQAHRSPIFPPVSGKDRGESEF